MIELTISGKTIRVVEGDITDRDTDAIVNAANNHLWMGAGVAGAIKSKGGVIIEKEAMAQGPIAVGDAVVTSAGLLRNRYVIHAAGMGQDLTTDEGKIRTVTLNTLKRCVEFGIDSVSFPTIGTGVGGFPIGECARIMLGAAADHFAENDLPTLVEFVLWGTKAYEEFVKEAGERLYK
jgi:O-acetyl-ADP-ribose deacetylase (regulator of RNase III)